MSFLSRGCLALRCQEDLMVKAETSALGGIPRRITAGTSACAPPNGEPEPPVAGRPVP